MTRPDEFHQQLRDALNHLYDYPYLESHPLILRFWPDAAPSGTPLAYRLSRLLLETIEQLHPPGQSSEESSHSRAYPLLISRFVDEQPVDEIMRRLGYSRRQVFRELHRAIAMLAERLEARYPARRQGPTQSTEMLKVEAERFLTQREAVDLIPIVQEVVTVAQRLAEQRRVILEYSPGAEYLPVYSNRTLLRQLFLAGLSTVLSLPGVQQVHFRLLLDGGRVKVELSSRFATEHPMPAETFREDRSDLETLHRLVEILGGYWGGLEADGRGYVCRFDLPVDRSKVVLVIEDNEGVIQAFQRYLAGYDYRVVGARSGEEALQLARALNPAAITLDVMLPGHDGWEILQTLKSDRETRKIPVIICSVLVDPALAQLLGAATYLRKPVTQADLLSALSGLSSVD